MQKISTLTILTHDLLHFAVILAKNCSVFVYTYRELLVFGDEDLCLPPDVALRAMPCPDRTSHPNTRWCVHVQVVDVSAVHVIPEGQTLADGRGGD